MRGVTDAIDRLAGIAPGSALDAARARRPVARTQAQASYDTLFHPTDPGEMSLPERSAVAAFVAALHGMEDAAAGHLASLPPALAGTVQAAAAAAAGQGPYGSYPAGPLTPEDRPGPSYQVPEPHRAALGPRLAAALDHAHMLVLHPRDAAPDHLQALLDAGWTTADIVTLSQLVAFLSYQLRAAAGLRVLAATGAQP